MKDKKSVDVFISHKEFWDKVQEDFIKDPPEFAVRISERVENIRFISFENCLEIYEEG